MRVCTPHCGLAPESGSGGEVYERELLRSLAGMGVDCHILLARGKAHEKVPGWTVHPVWPPKGLRWPVTPFVFPRAIKRVWDRGAFDVLRAHSVRYTGPAALWARRRYRLPVPVITHHHHLDPSPLNPLIERRVLEASDCVVTDSAFARQQLRDELGIFKDRIVVIHCGVSAKYTPQAFDASLSRRWGLTGKLVLMSVGPLIARKNPFMALEVLREVRQSVGRNVVLVWIGRGPLLARLVRYARSIGVEDAVVWTGYLPETDKVAMLNLADVFVFPSRLEGYPLAPQEAMACGTPVVAFRVASMGEMITNGASGFLAADWSDFVAKVTLLLRDSACRVKIGCTAASNVMRWDETARRVLATYEAVVGDYRRASRRSVVGVLPASGSGLTDLRRGGQADRLLGDLGAYVCAYDEVRYFSYFDERLKDFTTDAKLLDRVKVVPRRWRVGRYLYALLLPILERASLSTCSVVRVEQFTGVVPALIARLLYGVRYVVTYGYHYEAVARIAGSRWKALCLAVLRRLAVPMAAGLVVPNPTLADMLRRRWPMVPMLRNPNGVDTAWFSPGSRSVRHLHDPPFVLYVGRLSAEKNVLGLVDAVASLPTRVLLWLVGNGVQRSEILRRALELGVALQIIGPVRNPAMPDVYRQADCFVLPSLTEGHPKALLEAMSCGVPCVVSDRGGNCDLIEDGVTGLRVNPESTAAIATGIARVLGDRVLAERLGRAARAKMLTGGYELAVLRDAEVRFVRSVTGGGGHE